ncbi:conjugative transposon protein TraM [uncultured Flavobacterium sp.]|uniref:conjugative transposon protein TraM n=1 Tax=uncultured Flavobacterium sp. TaxID=165435 RepID=UPI0025928A31|nr:conjugative transposon protein TraM [uncultured Flavobacterium sp.]
MADFNNFVKTDKGRYVVIACLTLICGFIFYFLFFSKESEKNKNEKSTSADINVSVRDTTFKERGDVYSSYEKKVKKVETDEDFFKSGTEEMKQALNNPVTAGGKTEEDLQRMADSILKANQTKVNYGNSNPKKTINYSSNYTSAPKVDREKLRQEEIERFQKKSKSSFDEFFEGANSKTKSSASVNQSSQKPLPSDAMIYAVISGDQVIKNKDRVTLKLTQDALIHGEIYRKNTFIYAIAKFTQNRVNLEISNINQKQVSLIAQDAMDGNTGIYIEGESLVAETANEAAQDGVNNINVKGIPVGRTIQRLVSKKQKESRVQLLNNYKIILKTE